MLFGFSASGTIEVGVLYAFISYLGRLNEPLIELTTHRRCCNRLLLLVSACLN
ncbi:multidrug ABC transporter ATP-binding protein [Escherichia coli]|uniref:Multidrug ABC transporter ATP-binding protein n=1 Tax=Escherichia coli TaxID=562 RepID=A0A377AZF1_ECOLX|nr:multidrug ABC transporter ATP-binding protein [Escherichia coli]